jgi:hypothetical protein
VMASARSAMRTALRQGVRASACTAARASAPRPPAARPESKCARRWRVLTHRGEPARGQGVQRLPPPLARDSYATSRTSACLKPLAGADKRATRSARSGPRPRRAPSSRPRVAHPQRLQAASSPKPEHAEAATASRHASSTHRG